MIELLVAFVLWESNASAGWWVAYGFMCSIQVLIAIRGEK